MSVRGVKQDMGEQSSQDLMTVGELASRVGVTVRTIQYYDQRGLLHPTCKGEQNLRLYSSSDVDRLNRIITLKYLGLSLSQIQESEGSDPDGELTSALAEREAELERESARILRDMNALQSLRAHLALSLIHICARPPSVCLAMAWKADKARSSRDAP